MTLTIKPVEKHPDGYLYVEWQAECLGLTVGNRWQFYARQTFMRDDREVAAWVEANVKAQAELLWLTAWEKEQQDAEVARVTGILRGSVVEVAEVEVTDTFRVSDDPTAEPVTRKIVLTADGKASAPETVAAAVAPKEG